MVIGSRQHPETIAANLFKMLRKCDYHNIQKVYAEGFEETELGLAIMPVLYPSAFDFLASSVILLTVLSTLPLTITTSADGE